ncbi:MAG: hypothetical protein DSM106950_35215 [Stigonema ocellatum SAG 48.90 = DSM 106950]|nr:hypothetical protein [Stigonema ocellatum SAG 48.90 = DSM 106950]
MNRTGELDANQEAKVEQVAKLWAATIKKKNENALYYKDKIKYIKTKLKSGDVVEEAGSSRVQSHYNEPGVTVWSSMYLEFQDADGNKVGGEQAELDFFTFNEGGALPQIVSAKLDGSKVRKSQDRRLLRHSA